MTNEKTASVKDAGSKRFQSYALFWCYAFSQLINGSLGAFIGYKRLMIIGLLYIILLVLTLFATKLKTRNI